LHFRAFFPVVLISLALSSAGCGGRQRTRVPPSAPPLSSHELEGLASWYGPDFHGRQTANGEIYDMNDYTAAHRTLPFGTIVRVENMNNHRTVVVRINDRGPFKPGRVIDLSHIAARKLDMIRDGIIPVRLTVLN